MERRQVRDRPFALLAARYPAGGRFQFQDAGKQQGRPFFGASLSL